MRTFVACLMLGTSCGGSDDSDTDPATETPVDAPITEKAFAREFNRKLCKAVEKCEGAFPCEPVDWSGQCQFDPVLAELCLDGEFLCVDAAGDAANYVEPPEECTDVYSYCR